MVIHCAGFGSLRSDSSDYDDAERSCQACVQNVSKALKKSTNSIQHMSYLEIPMRFLVLPRLVFFFFVSGFPCFWEAVSNRPKIAGESTMHIQPKVSWPTIEMHFWYVAPLGSLSQYPCLSCLRAPVRQN